MLAQRQYGTYFFFASLMVLAAFFVFFLIPETKSVPLEAMDREPMGRFSLASAAMSSISGKTFKIQRCSKKRSRRILGSTVDKYTMMSKA